MMIALKDAFANAGNPNARGTGGFSEATEELFKKGMLPIQMEEKRDGETISTVTFVKFEEKKLDDALFAIPQDIHVMEMPAMGRPPMGVDQEK